jgi:hypothetical protein
MPPPPPPPPAVAVPLNNAQQQNHQPADRANRVIYNEIEDYISKQKKIYKKYLIRHILKSTLFRWQISWITRITS